MIEHVGVCGFIAMAKNYETLPQWKEHLTDFHGSCSLRLTDAQRSAVHHFDVDGKSKAELDAFLLALGCRRVPTRVGENTARKRVDLMCRALRSRFPGGAWFFLLLPWHVSLHFVVCVRFCFCLSATLPLLTGG